MSWRRAGRRVVLLPLLLASGCFAGSEPLLNASNASTPFRDGATVTEYANCAAPAAALLGCKGYLEQGSEMLSLKHGTYLVSPDPTDDQQAIMAQDGGGGGKMEVLFKSIGAGAFIVQLDMGASAAPDRYLYEMMTFEGNTGYVYQMECEQSGDAANVRAGLLKAIVPGMMVPTCETASFDGLAQVFRQRLAAGVAPIKKIIVSD